MTAPNANNVSVGKPHGEDDRYAGGFWYGIKSKVTVPTDAVTTLDENFVDGGYLSDDGVTNSVDRDTTTVTAFGGDTVLNVTASKTETFQFGMLETSRDVMAFVYGADNVSGTDDAFVVKHNAKDNPHLVDVFEFAMTGDRVKRIVIPDGQVSDLDDVSYADGDAIVYTPTITAYPDSAGNTAYEYIAKVATGTSAQAEAAGLAVYDDESAPSLEKAAVSDSSTEAADSGEVSTEATA